MKPFSYPLAMGVSLPTPVYGNLVTYGSRDAREGPEPCAARIIRVFFLFATPSICLQSLFFSTACDHFDKVTTLFVCVCLSFFCSVCSSHLLSSHFSSFSLSIDVTRIRGDQVRSFPPSPTLRYACFSFFTRTLQHFLADSSVELYLPTP